MGVSSKPKVDNSYQKWSIKEADRARIEEEARQNRIEAGMEQIRAIFEGGTTSTPVAATTFDPNATYYLGDGAEWSPIAQTRTVTKEPIYAPAAAPSPARPAAPVARPNPMEATVRKGKGGRTGRIVSGGVAWNSDNDSRFAGSEDGLYNRPRGVTALPGYDPVRFERPRGVTALPGSPQPGEIVKPGKLDNVGPRQIGTRKVEKLTGLDPAAQFKKMIGDLFVRGKGQTFGGVKPILDARRKAAESFYFPQLDKNRRDAQDELTFALSRAGLLGSTAERTKGADLAESFNIEKAQVAADIDRDVSQAESAYADQRAAIEAALRASADPTAATNAAISASKRFAAERPQLSALPNTLAAVADGVGGARQAADVARIRGIARGSTVNRDASRVYG